MLDDAGVVVRSAAIMSAGVRAGGSVEPVRSRAFEVE
jgi:hypothetical protein